MSEELLLNQVAIVTGGAQGIGRAIALAMAREGASIVVADINPGEAAKVKEEIEVFKREARVIHCDVGKRWDLEKLVTEALGSFGRIDILVNNVGVSGGRGFLERGFEEWQRVAQVNLIGPGELTRRVAIEMLKRRTRGKIIFISSIHQDVIGGHPLYSTSKAAVGMLVKELGFSLGRRGIRVVGIAPGAIRTDWATRLEKEDPERYRQWVENMPLGRLGEPEEVAELAVFLASEKAAYISGTVVTIDGAVSTSTWKSGYPWFGGGEREFLKYIGEPS